MSKTNLEYFIEILGDGKLDLFTGSFNLWEREGRVYRNRATLFLNDRLCGCQWDVSDKQKSVKYNASEIKNEIENPLKLVSCEVAEHLLDMEGKTYRDVLEYLESITHEKGDFAGLKYVRNSGEHK